jgi:hypothetical protein
MNPTQAEILLRLAENTDVAGDEVNSEITRLGREHALRLLNDLDLLNKAMEINRLGRERFAHFMPRPATPQSIRQALQQPALTHGGKDETQTQEQRPASGQRS